MRERGWKTRAVKRTEAVRWTVSSCHSLCSSPSHTVRSGGTGPLPSVTVPPGGMEGEEMNRVNHARLCRSVPVTHILTLSGRSLQSQPFHRESFYVTGTPPLLTLLAHSSRPSSREPRSAAERLPSARRKVRRGMARGREKIPREGEFTLRTDPWAGLIASTGSFYLMVYPLPLSARGSVVHPSLPHLSPPSAHGRNGVRREGETGE